MEIDKQKTGAHEYAYREIIYKDYTEHLEAVSAYSVPEKEMDVVLKYFNKNYLPHMPADKTAKIIDIGCGRGSYINALIKNGYLNVLGIDMSPANIALCTELGYTCQFAEGERYLKNHRDEFDVIILNDVLEHLSKNEIVAMLTAIKAGLRKGGTVIFKVPNAANPYVGAASRYMDFTHEIAFTDTVILQVMRACEFTDVRVMGADIYVFGGPVNLFAKILAQLVCMHLRFMGRLFGRTSVKIFEKGLICTAKR